MSPAWSNNGAVRVQCSVVQCFFLPALVRHDRRSTPPTHIPSFLCHFLFKIPGKRHYGMAAYQRCTGIAAYRRASTPSEMATRDYRFSGHCFFTPRSYLPVVSSQVLYRIRHNAGLHHEHRRPEKSVEPCPCLPSHIRIMSDTSH